MMHHNSGNSGTVSGKPKPKPKLLTKASSFAILQEPLVPRDDQRSSLAESVDVNAPEARSGSAGSPQATVVAVDISLRRGRIALGTVVMVSVLVALVEFFKHGYEIRRYNKATLDAAQQKSILDTYNSRSGSIVSAFSTPIEIFVTACVQVILLRFVSASLLRNEPSWKAVYAALALSAGVGYLINNGFNALNVQLVDLEVHSVVKASDLSLNETAISSSSDWQSRVTNVSWSVSEAQARNPIANTVLRNLVQSRAIRAKTVCAPSQYNEMFKPMPLDTVEYGFPQRDWMKQLLPEALPVRSLVLTLNPTNKSANNGVQSEQLPMNASIASNLVLSAMALAPDFIPMAASLYLPDYNKNLSDTDTLTYNTSAAIRVGILPPDQAASDADQKKWFLGSMNKFFITAFNRTENMTLTNVPVNFTHVEIAPNVAFDAVTFEIDVDPSRLFDVQNKKTGARYMNEGGDYTTFSNNGLSCAPWPARCVFKKRDPMVASFTVANGDLYYDAPAQIQAFSICLNDNGTELMQTSGNGDYPSFLNVEPCARVSTTSMLLLSVGKRIIADALTENTTANATGVYAGGFGGSAVNLRKIYSYTVGRLSWEPQDISKAFGAACDVPSGEKCQGLVVELNKTSPGAALQRLVVGADSVPMDALLQPELGNFMLDHAYRQRPLTLVQVKEPTRQLNPTDWYDVAAGDILYPHNIRNLTWDQSRKSSRYLCVITEERVQRVLDNHMYIEHPLQATYTAGMFFLLQNAVVKDAIVNDQRPLSAATMLSFDGNTQEVALSVSTPSMNALLTQLGCLVLVIGVAATIAWATIVRTSSSRANFLAGITDAEVIARAKLDEKTFPPLLLHRRVANTSGESVERRGFDHLVIASLSLQRGHADQYAAVDRTTDDEEHSPSIRLSVHS